MTRASTIEAGSRAPAPAERGDRRTRARLLAAARQAFAELGYVATRVDDVVARAGTSHGTFYVYFRDKKDALDALTADFESLLYDAVVAPEGDADHPTPAAVARARVGSFLATYDGHRDVMRAWGQAEGVHEDVEAARVRLRHSIASAMAGVLERDQRRGLVEPGVDLDVAATAIVAMAEGFANDRASSDRPILESDVDELAAMMTRALYRRPS